MIVLFLISAALQYNDPDPYVWIPLYLLGAWLCWKANQGSYPPPIYLAAAIIYIGYAAYLFVAADGVASWVNDHDTESLVQTMKAEKPWIEQSREFGGLLILLFSLAVNWITKPRNPTTP